jgi:hypothetical protein
MNKYITFDGKQYKTLSTTWMETEVSPRQIKRLLSGVGDVTFGPSSYLTWKGDVVTLAVADGSHPERGTLATLETAFRKRTPLTMIDHYGVSRSVTMSGSIDKRSVLPVWDVAGNEFRIHVEITSL